MAATPLATLKRVAEKIGYAFHGAGEGFWYFTHDSMPEEPSLSFPSKREAYRAALVDYSRANQGDIVLDGL